MIHIYSKPACPNCDKAKKILGQYQISYQETILDGPETILMFKTKYPMVRAVPFILDDDKVIGGYNELLKHII
jgi:glutaredoxin 3